jgi:hypothetical protein
MLTMLWDSQEPILELYQERIVMLNSACYSETLRDKHPGSILGLWWTTRHWDSRDFTRVTLIMNYFYGFPFFT